MLTLRYLRFEPQKYTEKKKEKSSSSEQEDFLRFSYVFLYKTSMPQGGPYLPPGLLFKKFDAGLLDKALY